MCVILRLTYCRLNLLSRTLIAINRLIDLQPTSIDTEQCIRLTGNLSIGLSG